MQHKVSKDDKSIKQSCDKIISTLQHNILFSFCTFELMDDMQELTKNKGNRQNY